MRTENAIIRRKGIPKLPTESEVEVLLYFVNNSVVTSTPIRRTMKNKDISEIPANTGFGEM